MRRFPWPTVCRRQKRSCCRRSVCTRLRVPPAGPGGGASSLAAGVVQKGTQLRGETSVNNFKCHPLINHIIDRGLVALFCIALVLSAVVYSDNRLCTEFVGYYVAGQTGLRGLMVKAYESGYISDAERTFCGGNCPMLWFYPPPFGLIANALALLPFHISYFIFTSITLMWYSAVLRKLSINLLSYNLSRIAILPSILTTIWVGQNCFLTAALIGAGSQAILSGRKAAGVPLGLLIVIKPHLAVGIALFCVFRGKWSVVGVAGLVVAVASIFSTLAFGAAIWPAFLESIKTSSRLLASGSLFLSRMTSIYSAAYTAGLSSDAAIRFQIIAAFACAIAIYISCYFCWNDRKALGYALILSFGFSPYVYFYDCTILAIGIALLLPIVLRCGSVFENILLLGLCLVMSGYGLFQKAAFGDEGLTQLSVGGFAYLLLAGVMSNILFRHDRGCVERVQFNNSDGSGLLNSAKGTFLILDWLLPFQVTPDWRPKQSARRFRSIRPQDDFF